MTPQEREVDEAWAWLCETARNLDYGEAGVKLIIHGGRIVRVERTFVERRVANANGKQALRAD